MEKGFVAVITVLLKGLDQLPEQLLTLLLPEVEDVPKGVHDGIDSAQSVEVALPVSAPALCHQLVIGKGVGEERGGGRPGAAETLLTELRWHPPV
jgi:hypothetical protein